MDNSMLFFQDRKSAYPAQPQIVDPSPVEHWLTHSQQLAFHPAFDMQNLYASTEDGYTFTTEHHEEYSQAWSTQSSYNSSLGLQLDTQPILPSLISSPSWNDYQFAQDVASPSNYLSPTYSPDAVGPFAIPTPSLTQASPVGSEMSLALSPLYPASSHLPSPTTPASQHLPSPSASDLNNMLLLEPQGTVHDPKLILTHKEQLVKFKEATNLPCDGTGPFVPQPMYKPHTTSDRKRYVEDTLLEMPLYFISEHTNQYGILLKDALHLRTKKLHDRDQVVFEGRGPSVSIRLEWPGYRQWSRQIPTKDFRSPPQPITLAKLAKNVAKCVQRFMTDRKNQPMEEDANPFWKIGDGPNDIKLEDLMLVSIHHVSLGSWQPQLRLVRPRQRQVAMPIMSPTPMTNYALSPIHFPARI